MMPDLGRYAFAVWASYGASSLMVLGFCWWRWRNYRRAVKRLRDLQHDA